MFRRNVVFGEGRADRAGVRAKGAADADGGVDEQLTARVRVVASRSRTVDRIDGTDFDTGGDELPLAA